MTDTKDRPAVEATDRPGIDALGKTASDARHAASDRAAQVSDRVRAAGQDVRDRASDEAEDLKDLSGRELSKTASALQTAADELEESPAQQHLLREAANGLNEISEALRGRSVEQIVKGLADAGRRNPAAFLGGAALTGFALARFALATASPDIHDDRYAGSSREVAPPKPSPLAPTRHAEVPPVSGDPSMLATPAVRRSSDV